MKPRVQSPNLVRVLMIAVLAIQLVMGVTSPAKALFDSDEIVS